MKTIKVFFYKNSKTIFGKLIVWKQDKRLPRRYARYSHSELVFEDGRFFSSSEVDGSVRFKNIIPKPENWDYIELKVSDEAYDRVLNFCKINIGNSYNFVGIFFAQILNFYIKKHGDWFCSEICSRALQEIGFLCAESSLFVSPGKLALLLEQKGYLIKELR